MVAMSRLLLCLTCALPLAACGGGSGGPDAAGGDDAPVLDARVPPPPVESLFRADFDDLDESAPNLYNFANRYAQSDTTWETDHLPTGGWNGTGGAHVVVHGCEPGPTCNQSDHQFNTGWVTPPLDHTFAMGDELFIRFRIKFDDDVRFPIESFGAKFILNGHTGVEPNSRWIIHLMPPFKNQGCTLGFDYSSMGWAPPATTWVESGDWGFATNFDAGGIVGLYASFQSNVNISWSCNPGVLVTAKNHSAPAPKPANVGAAPVDGWYHLQFQAISGEDDLSGFRTWVNNNDLTQPSTEHLNMEEGLGVTGWSDGADVGGYWGVAYQGDVGYVIDDFEMGVVFDPNWAQ
jgi:hypothetical protein